MRWRCGFATAKAPDAVKGSNGIAPGFAGAHYLSGEDVLNATAKSTDNLTLLVPHSSAVTFSSAKHLPALPIRARPLATDSVAKGFTHAVGVRCRANKKGNHSS